MSTNRGGTMVANLFARLGADTTEYEKKMRRAVTQMLFSAESFTQAGRIMSTAITAPMALIGGAAFKMALDFDRAMTKINTLVGVNKDLLDSWKPKILDIAASTGRSATEMAEALFFITSNGFRTSEALDILNASAMGAAIGLGETKDIAFAATSAMNAYGQGAMTANEAVSVLVATVREGNLEAADLPPVLGQLLPIAAAMGIEFTEVGAALATMTRSGTSARLAALGMKSVMISILQPTKGASKAALEMGFSMEKMAAIAKDDLFLALDLMKDKVEESGRSWKAIFPNAKAFTAVLQLMGENADETEKIFKSMSETTGKDVVDTFDKVTGPAQQMARAIANIKTAMVTLGDNMTGVAGTLEGISSSVRGTMNAFDRLGPVMKGIISGFTSLVFITGPVLYGIGSLARVLARFTGLSILFQLDWVKNVAAIMAGQKAAESASITMKGLNMSMGQSAGLIVGVGLAAYQFGKFLDDAFGITKSLNEEFGRFGETSKEIAKAMDKNAASTTNAYLAAFDLAAAIGDNNLARELETAYIEGNMEQVSKLIDKINEQARAYNKATVKVDGLTEAERKQLEQEKLLADEKAREIAAQKESIENLREERGLYNKQAVIDQLEQLHQEYTGLLDDGVLAKDLNENMLDDLMNLLEQAKKFGVALPEGIVEMSKAMENQGLVSAAKLWDLFQRINFEADLTPGIVIDGMIKIEGQVAESLKGGFNRGFTEVLTEYDAFGNQLRAAMDATWRGGFSGFGDAVRDEINSIVEEAGPFQVKVAPDQVYWDAAMADTISGNRPLTGG